MDKGQYVSKGNMFQNVDINCLSCIESGQFSRYFGSDASFFETVLLSEFFSDIKYQNNWYPETVK